MPNAASATKLRNPFPANQVFSSLTLVTIEPGTFIFNRRLQFDEWTGTLIRVPKPAKEFAAFCQLAEERAGPTIYQKIIKGELVGSHANQDFRGQWLLESPYVIRKWTGAKVPSNIEQAIGQLRGAEVTALIND